MQKGKNGKIELYRFLFCMIILLFHCGRYFVGGVSFNDGIDFSIFGHGAIGVEFFFVLSGFLMKKTISKNINTVPDEKALSKEYLSFLKRKYMSIFPYHVIAFVITVICFLLKKGYGIRRAAYYIFGSLPNFFLIEMSGIRFNEPNHIEWYISCIMLSMAILYPVCRKHYYMFSRCIAPLLSVFIYGYLIYTTGSLTGVTVWLGHCFKSFLRSVAGISMGTIAFDVAEFLSQKDFTKTQRVLLTVSEYALLISAVLFALITAPVRFEVYIPVCFVFLTALAFSGCTYGSSLFNNRLCLHLGKLSLPIYLGQLAAIYFVKALFSSVFTARVNVCLTVVITIVFAYLIMLIYKLVHTAYSKRKAV